MFNATTGARAVIGTIPSMGADEALEAVRAAAAAWDRGQGEWPRLPLAKRIAAIEALVVELQAVRGQMVEVLEWEIAKTSSDAAAEFDRTMQFIAALIAELKRDPNLGQVAAVVVALTPTPTPTPNNPDPNNYNSCSTRGRAWQGGRPSLVWVCACGAGRWG